MKAYEYKNARGITYYLFKTDITLRGGSTHPTYYFNSDKNHDFGEPCSSLPDGYEVVESPMTGKVHVITTEPKYEKNTGVSNEQ